MQYQPNLFIRDIGNATSYQITRVIEDLGFGRVRYIDFQGISAIIIMDYWDIQNTPSTRTILYEGRPILLYYSDNRCWKAYAYKSKEERQIEEMLIKEALAQQKRQADEEKRQADEEKRQDEQKRQEEEQDKNQIFDIDISSISNVILDYGNAYEMYPLIRDKYNSIFNKIRCVLEL